MTPAVKIFSLFIVLAGILLVTNLLTPQKSQSRMIINGQTVFVEIADTPEKIVQGLSGKEKMASNQGMLFIFKEAGNYPTQSFNQVLEINAGQIKKLNLKIGDKIFLK